MKRIIKVAYFYYNKALKMNDRYAEAYCQRGLIKIATGDKTACDDIKKAVKLELEDAKACLKEHCKYIFRSINKQLL